MTAHQVSIPPLGLAGILDVPPGAKGLILFAHGNGTSRFSPRDAAIALTFNRFGFGTLLLDLLKTDESNRRKVVDIRLLAKRLVAAIHWIGNQAELTQLPLGLFGAATGAAVALLAAAELGEKVGVVISRGGRPNLLGSALGSVRSPTLLVVGGKDEVLLELNIEALSRLKTEAALRIVPGATHLFSEPGSLEAVSKFAVEWISAHLCPDRIAMPRHVGKE